MVEHETILRFAFWIKKKIFMTCRLFFQILKKSLYALHVVEAQKAVTASPTYFITRGNSWPQTLTRTHELRWWIRNHPCTNMATGICNRVVQTGWWSAPSKWQKFSAQIWGKCAIGTATRVPPKPSSSETDALEYTSFKDCYSWILLLDMLAITSQATHDTLKRKYFLVTPRYIWVRSCNVFYMLNYELPHYYSTKFTLSCTFMIGYMHLPFANCSFY